MLLPLLLALLAAAHAPALAEAKCVMTQTCVNPDNVPDYDQCIPEAHKEPVDPQPVRLHNSTSIILLPNMATSAVPIFA